MSDFLLSAEQLLERAGRHADGEDGGLAARVLAGMEQREAAQGGPRVQDPRRPRVVAASPYKTSHDRLVELHADKVRGKRVRFVNMNEQIRNLRRFQGYEPVLDGSEEIKDMDTVMMAMPEARHQAEIAGPREETKRQKQEAIQENYADSIRELGGEPLGGIDVDKRVASEGKQ